MRRLALLLAACLCIAATPGGQTLIDQDGNPVPASELADRWLLVYFGYSTCPDRCPAALTTVSAVLGRLGTRGAELTPIFVSLDPAHDTPARLKVYAANFSARLRALTGSEEAVADAARSFGVPWQPRAGGGFDHGLLLYLVAPGGQVVETFHPDVAPAAVADRIRMRLTARAH